MDNRFALFRYEPDYLLDTDGHRASITDNSIASRYLGTSYLHDCRHIKLDGGNFISAHGKVIMTAKVFEENPHYSPLELLKELTNTFGAEIIILPWDTNEIYGHTDGIVRFIDDDSVLMTNYAQFDPAMATRFRRILQTHFKKVYELSFKTAKPHKYSWPTSTGFKRIRFSSCRNSAYPKTRKRMSRYPSLCYSTRIVLRWWMPQT